MFSYFKLLLIFILYLFYTSNIYSQDKIDLNKANLDQLKALPGIGEVTAKAIIELREKKGGFKSIEELKEVKGIGEKKLEVLKNYLIIGGETKDSTLTRSATNATEEIEELKKGKIYMYKDDKGILHYTQFPETVPEKYRKSLKPIF
ncbi:MAG: ComEA family DNA-binding protein [Caldimicrobium sp.]